ncbi:hypothetical protein WICMUC_003286 [Wickerhamomyces mucosus]|uniref:RRM domain-containing protein n=1 Tax=Wickerhamomyces mucosus TaxID=1378264 RepID=A0A9P8TD81_9ASCO|nr:hypothetical protein WICMUC_003286 [Wickerhamomyces mucosus]
MSDVEESSSKKRNLDLEEIEIDLTQTAPLSKKQKRLLRKGKLDIEKLEAEQKKEAEKLLKKGGVDEDDEDNDNKENDEEDTTKKEKKIRIGVWIGNLSFDTEKGDLIRFITSKTSDFNEYSEELADDEFCQVNEKDILRVNLPTQGKDSKKIKGFCYIDFPTKTHQKTVISLSEQQLNGRNLLIKNADSFEGRPTKEEGQLSKNPPSRILFVGNLSFDTTNDLLTQQFQHCGEIIKIRMATFEDTGKCKGFAFLDFKDETGPTKALKDKSCRKLMNRPLRLEFGEDRSKRNPKQINRERNNDQDRDTRGSSYNERDETPVDQSYERPERSERLERTPKPRINKKPFKRDAPQERQKSSVALASAQRASAAIVKSTGVKKTFD